MYYLKSIKNKFINFFKSTSISCLSLKSPKWISLKWLSILFLYLNIPPALTTFSEKTLVKTKLACIPIYLLEEHDVVISCQGDICLNKPISKTYEEKVQQCISISLIDDVIITSPNQKLYCVENKRFQRADEFTVGQHLLSLNGNHYSIFAISKLDCDETFCGLTVDEFHTYFVSHSEILVHNAIPLVIGATWAFGGGAIEFVGASIGVVALFGATLGVGWKKDNGFKFNFLSGDNKSYFKIIPPNENDWRHILNNKLHDHGFNGKDPKKIWNVAEAVLIASVSNRELQDNAEYTIDKITELGNLVIKGKVIDGVVRIGTMFIKQVWQ